MRNMWPVYVFLFLLFGILAAAAAWAFCGTRLFGVCHRVPTWQVVATVGVVSGAVVVAIAELQNS